MQRSGAKYWIGRHDEVKRGGGLLAWVLKRRIWGVDEILKRAGLIDEGDEMCIRHHTLQSGESLELASILRWPAKSRAEHGSRG